LDAQPLAAGAKRSQAVVMTIARDDPGLIFGEHRDV